MQSRDGKDRGKGKEEERGFHQAAEWKGNESELDPGQ